METAKLQKQASTMLDPKILMPAITSAFVKLDPRLMAKNPVMFVVEIVAALTTVIFVRDLLTGGASLGFTFQIILWLWFTVLFANFAEAVAEGRGKAQAESLRKTRTESQAKLLTGTDRTFRLVPGTSLKVGDIVLVEAGDNIPSDGEVIEGVASVNEAAITGESAPVIRESGGDRSAVTGGTQVLSDWIRVRITAAQGSTFIDRMIKLVEGAERQKTPNEIALNILLAGLTIIFVFATVTIPSYAAYAGGSISVVVLVALFVTLIPTTIGALLSAIGIAGMDRLVRFNVLAMSGRAVEAAGDVDTLLLDKTGTITLGNRQATAFRPIRGVSEQDLADAAQLASLADETPEGRSIVVLAKEKYGIRGRDMHELAATFVPFTAQTRMSGIDAGTSSVRKGAVDAILAYVDGGEPRTVASGNTIRSVAATTSAEAREIQAIADEIAKAHGGTLSVRSTEATGTVFTFTWPGGTSPSGAALPRSSRNLSGSLRNARTSENMCGIVDLQLPSKVEEFGEAGIAGDIERDLAGERRQRSAIAVVADHLRRTVALGADAHPHQEALIGEVGHRHQRRCAAQLGEAKHQRIVGARCGCGGRTRQHTEAADFPGVAATRKAALCQLREDRLGEIGVVGADGAEAADQFRAEKQQAMFGIPDVELVALDVAGRGQKPAAMIDEQLLAQPEHRLNMCRIALLGRDERMV